MTGIILILISTFFLEVSTVIGKTEVKLKKETIYTFGFLGMFWSAVWFFAIIIFRQNFSFSLESLPTFLLRAFFEIISIGIAIRAIVQTDRSTYSFLKIMTVPLLLLVDLVLGYSLSLYQIIGIAVICTAIGAALYIQEVNKKGLRLIILASILAVFTISLFKYDITHFNNVETEQFLIYLILLIYFLIRIYLEKLPNPFKLLIKQPYASQAITHGLGGVLTSFAFLLGPASIIVAAERSLAILWAILSGNIYFKEKHFLIKISIFLTLGVGLYLLTKTAK